MHLHLIQRHLIHARERNYAEASVVSLFTIPPCGFQTHLKRQAAQRLLIRKADECAGIYYTGGAAGANGNETMQQKHLSTIAFASSDT